jgi:hypothetical protein
VLIVLAMLAIVFGALLLSSYDKITDRTVLPSLLPLVANALNFAGSEPLRSLLFAVNFFTLVYGIYIYVAKTAKEHLGLALTFMLVAGFTLAAEPVLRFVISFDAWKPSAITISVYKEYVFSIIITLCFFFVDFCRARLATDSTTKDICGFAWAYVSFPSICTLLLALAVHTILLKLGFPPVQSFSFLTGVGIAIMFLGNLTLALVTFPAYAASIVIRYN